MDSKLRKFFWKFILMTNKTDQCWLWIGKRDENGYGRFGNFLEKKQERAHRVSYFLFKGEISNGLHVCHSCDNPSCVNPNHLWIGTNDDNIRDRHKKGRDPLKPGEENIAAKLTLKEVKKIRKLYIKNEYGYKRLGKQFSVNWRTVADIIKNKTWI